jgi:hypothetical protein
MKPPHVTIAGLMVLVGFLAANFAAARALGLGSRSEVAFYWLAFAPFELTLLVAFRRLARGRGPARWFWGGFLVVGSMALASLACFCIDTPSSYLATRLWDGYNTLLNDGFDQVARLTDWLSYGVVPIIDGVLVAVAVYLPQLAVALAGGLIARSIAEVATRRRGSVAAGDDARDAGVR